jgi:hypothetical protein
MSCSYATQMVKIKLKKTNFYSPIVSSWMQPISIRFTIRIPSRLYLGPHVISSFVFQPTFFVSNFPHVCYIFNSLVLNLITLTTLGEVYKFLSSQLCKFLQPVDALYLLGHLLFWALCFQRSLLRVTGILRL